MVKTKVTWFWCPIYFENYRACLGPVGGALHKFWGFEAIMRHHEYEMICFRTAVCKYPGPLRSHRKGFVFKICIWISVFRRKKAFENPILSCQQICKINTVPFFLKHLVLLNKIERKHQRKISMFWAFRLSKVAS